MTVYHSWWANQGFASFMLWRVITFKKDGWLHETLVGYLVCQPFPFRFSLSRSCHHRQRTAKRSFIRRRKVIYIIVVLNMKGYLIPGLWTMFAAQSWWTHSSRAMTRNPLKLPYQY